MRRSSGWPATWRRHGHDLTHRTGIAQGFATLGRIGFPGRFDYAAIGSVTNLAARLCADAGDWEVRVTDRVLAALDDRAEADLVGDVQPRGFSRPVRVHNIRVLRAQAGDPMSTTSTHHETEPDPLRPRPTTSATPRSTASSTACRTCGPRCGRHHR